MRSDRARRGLIAAALLAVMPRAIAARAANAPGIDLALQSGHAGFVSKLAFSPDGRWIASGGYDRTVRLWDLATGLSRKSLGSHGGRVYALAFRRDGRVLASAGEDNRIELWDVRTGRELRALDTGEHPMGIVAVAFDGDGRLVSLNQDRTVIVWNAETGERIRAFDAGGRDGPAFFTRLTPDGRCVMSALFNRGEERGRIEVQMWSVESGRRISATVIGPGDLNGPSISPDGRLIVSSDEHAAVHVRATATGRPVFSLPARTTGWTNATFSYAFTPDSRVLAIGDGDASPPRIQLVDAASGKVLQVVDTQHVEGLVFSADGRRIAGVRGNGFAVLDVVSGRTVQEMGGRVRAISSVAITGDGSFLAQESENRAVTLWDLRSGRAVRTLGGQTYLADAGATAVAFSPDARWLAASDEEEGQGGGLLSTVTVWEASSGRKHRSLRGFGNGVTSIAFSADGARMAAGDYSGVVKTYDTATWSETSSTKIEMTRIPPGRNLDRVVGATRVLGTAFSRDGRLLVVTTLEATRLWDLSTGSPSRVVRGGLLTASALSPDRKWLASADALSHRIELLDLEGGDTASFSSGQADVNAIAFSPDGSLLAFGSDDRAVRIRGLGGDGRTRVLAGHGSAVRAVAFTPDGRWLFSASMDGSVRAWNVSSGETAAVLATTPATRDWITFTPDGLFDGSPDGTQRLVAWQVDDRLYAADRFFASSFTPGLLGRILAGETVASQVAPSAARLPPDVRIGSPATGSRIAAETVRVVVEVADRGGGIRDVRLFQNGKLVARDDGAATKHEFQVELIPGENALRSAATGRDGTEANDDTIVVYRDERPNAGARAKPKLHLLVVGVGKYTDPDLDLAFARRDAEAMAALLRTSKLFEVSAPVALYDAAATGSAIREALAAITSRAAREDLVVVYLSGHGVGLGEQFYFLPTEMQRGIDEEAAVRKYGLPVTAIADALRESSALKQVLILDACQSEAALPVLAKAMVFHAKGLSVGGERTMKLLARSYGVYLIAASTKNEQAFENPALGHGLLTYALLTGLGEKGPPRAAASADGVVSIGSLVHYVVEQVPELTERYYHRIQLPVTWTTGTDFPLWVR